MKSYEKNMMMRSVSNYLSELSKIVALFPQIMEKRHNQSKGTNREDVLFMQGNNKQGCPKGQATQARALGPKKNLGPKFFILLSKKSLKISLIE